MRGIALDSQYTPAQGTYRMDCSATPIMCIHASTVSDVARRIRTRGAEPNGGTITGPGQSLPSSHPVTPSSTCHGCQWAIHVLSRISAASHHPEQGTPSPFASSLGERRWRQSHSAVWCGDYALGVASTSGRESAGTGSNAASSSSLVGTTMVPATIAAL